MDRLLKEKIIQAVEDLSEEEQKKLLQWIESLQKRRTRPPTGKLGLKRPFQREVIREVGDLERPGYPSLGSQERA